MKVENIAGFVLELNGKEKKMVEKIAKANKCSLSQAIVLAVQNFLNSGVQTPGAAAAVA